MNPPSERRPSVVVVREDSSRSCVADCLACGLAMSDVRTALAHARAKGHRVKVHDVRSFDYAPRERVR